MAAVTITEITDPFCTWCWGAEPLLRRLEETYRDQVDLSFVMGGLVEDFETFRDRANDITEPRDVAHHWEQAAERHGMPVDADVWRNDPPRSSYPANIAFEAAKQQDRELAHHYLRRLREAVTTECRNIAREPVLVDLASDVGLDTDALARDIQNGAAEDRFHEDLEFVRQSRATALPSFRVAARGEETWIKGFQPFEALRDAIVQVAPSLQTYEPRPIPDLIAHHGRLATREIAEVYEMSVGRTMQALRSLQEAGIVSATAVGTGYFWSVSERTACDSRSGPS